MRYPLFLFFLRVLKGYSTLREGIRVLCGERVFCGERFS